MAQGIRLRNRLTLWSLILFGLLFGGGGFFWFSSQEQQLESRLDEQLLSYVEDFDFLYSGAAAFDQTQAGTCKIFNQFTRHLDRNLGIALYTARGDLLCSNQQAIRLQLSLEAVQSKNGQGDIQVLTTLARSNGTLVRVITAPIIRQGDAVLKLQLARGLDHLHQRQWPLALSLSATWLVAMICCGITLWLLIGTLTSPLEDFTNHLKMVNEDNFLQGYAFPKSAGRELIALAENYTEMTCRIGRSLQRAKQFSADVTHELRTPLTILKGETELALRNDKSKNQLLEALASNLEEISRMSHLIEDLLMLSKSELGEIPLKLEALNLTAMLEELYGQAQILAEEKQISIEIRGLDNQVSLFADPYRLRQVFLNLLANAIKYTPDGGKVAIDCHLQGEQVRVIVEDTGIGIDSQHQEHIFDRFYRIDKTRNRHDGGSGLGLAIAKWIVDAHRGSIRVCSVPGQGSSFAVTLPLTILSGPAKETAPLLP